MKTEERDIELTSKNLFTVFVVGPIIKKDIEETGRIVLNNFRFYDALLKVFAHQSPPLFTIVLMDLIVFDRLLLLWSLSYNVSLVNRKIHL